ncbi:MAG: hypothetical protein LUC26_02580 [Prevotella sp.]|nr:hypothetical protein [Prevotella sp.]
MVSSHAFYFEQHDNVYLPPLRKAHRRGSSSSRWQRAYQAVKHNRAKELKKENLGNFISALAALYILNLYYNDQSFDIGNDSVGKSFDANVGSSVFSVMVHPHTGINVSGTYNKGKNFEKCVYLVNATDKTLKVATDALKAINEDVVKKTIEQALKEGVEPEDILIGFKNYYTEHQIEILKQVLSDREKNKNLIKSTTSLRYEAVLNRNQL